MGEMATMKEVFIQCQTGLQSHGKLCKTLQKIYDKTEFPTFWSEFSHYMKYAMIIFKREPAVERMVDFVAKFVTSFSKEEEKEIDEDGEKNEEDSIADNKLLQEMFDFLLESHSARDRGVRFRSCQLINKLLTNLGDEAQIDDNLYDRLYECMLERLKDKCPVVRYHAVHAMSRLQDPADENCPVIKAYLFLLNCDPNPDVRRAVLSCIAPSTKTLASIIGRTRDVKDTVRKTAYIVISEKIHIKALSIALRLQILNEGLSDRAEQVQQTCSGKLLKAWLRTFSGNIQDLLKSLDVEDSTEICINVLQTLFKGMTPQDIVEGFNLLNENLLIPEESLVSEAALYWQVVCRYLHDMGTDGEVYMEKVLPTCVEFCAYVQRYVEGLKEVEDPEVQLGREFIVDQLLLIAGYMDTADSASRKALENLLHNMLIADYVSHRTVKSVITRICDLKGVTESVVPYIAETVSEIREPIAVVERDVEAEQKRQTNLKIAGIRVQLNQLREDLEGAVKEQDFTKAAEIKAQVAELDAEKARLLEANEPAREEIRTEKNDPLTILKCMTIISEVLQVLKLNNVSPTLQMMIESQIVPGIQNETAEVRNMAMQALGLCCYLSKDLLVTYIPLFMQASQIDVEEVRVSALRILFDLLLVYGLEIVDASESSSSTSEGQSAAGDSAEVSMVADSDSKSDSRTGTASKLVAIICSFLDGESSDLRTCAAEGLSKLLLSGRVVSSKILSHLILLWYNPLSEDDTHLRDCLGTFFPMYALAGRSNQEVVEDAFLPTLRTLLNAPATSPLAEVNVNNVAELLVQLTNSKLITQNQNATETSQDNPGHDNLLETVCNEILTKPESPNIKLWVRIVNQMEPSPDNEVVLKDLRVLCYKMVKLVKDKQCLRGLQKFQETVNSLASKFVSGDDDLQNIEVGPVVPATEEEQEQEAGQQTPKQKRVRGLYSQASNMTLGLESDCELDISEDTTADVDASCLMSRVSTLSDTPTRRSRKNTTTELAEDNVFTVPEVPQDRRPSTVELVASKNTDVEKNETPAESPAEEVEDEGQSSKSPNKGSPGRKRAASTSPEKLKKSPGKRSRSEEIASPVKSPRGRKANDKVTQKSPANRRTTKSLEKRPASKSPSSKEVVPRKKSRSASGQRLSKSPEMKSSSKSPDKKGSASPKVRSGSKSPTKGTESKSPAKRAESKSPVRSASSSPTKKSSAKPSEKGSKLPEKKSQSKSPEKKTRGAEMRLTARPLVKKPEPKLPARKPLSKSPEKKVGKTNDKGLKTDTRSRIPAKSNEKPGQKVADKKLVAKPAAKPVEKNVRQAGVPAMAKKNPTNPKSQPPKTVATSARNSPRNTTRNLVSAPPTRNARRDADKPASKNQPLAVKRVAKSVADLPNAKSPRLRAKESVANTPESQQQQKKSQKLDKGKISAKPSPQSSRVPTLSIAETPSPRNTRVARQRGAIATPDSQTGRATRAGKSASSSASESSSPEKVANKSTKRKSSVVSSSESVSSQDSPVVNKGKNESNDDEDDVQLRRKARPSRRSAQAAAPTPQRTPRGAASGSPTVASPPASRRSTASRAGNQSTTRSPSKDQENQVPARKNTKASVSVSSTESSPKTPASRTTGRVLKSRTTTPRSQDSGSTNDSVFSTPGSARSTRSSKAVPVASRAQTRTTRTNTTGETKKSTQGQQVKVTRGTTATAGSRGLRSKSDRK